MDSPRHFSLRESFIILTTRYRISFRCTRFFRSLLIFSLLSAANLGYSTTVLPPQSKPLSSVLILYSYRTGHRESAANGKLISADLIVTQLTFYSLLCRCSSNLFCFYLFHKRRKNITDEIKKFESF